MVLNSKSTSWNPIDRVIFPAPLASYDIDSYPGELIIIPRPDGEKVPCLLMPFLHARFLFIYFHANAEDLGLCHSFCEIMRDLFQVHVLAVEYPGYGICAGTTDEDGIMANATAAIQFVTETLQWPCDGIKLFGRSLGTGPTVALASQYNVSGVILVSPFTSMRDIFRNQIGPLAEFVGDRFRNAELAEKIESPTLIIHGQSDTLIPLEHGRIVYDALHTRKMMVCPANMAHNTSLLKSIGTFVLPMTQFFSLPDYTFEDIVVPPWVYPSGVAPVPKADLEGMMDNDGTPTVNDNGQSFGASQSSAEATSKKSQDDDEEDHAQPPLLSPRPSPRAAETDDDKPNAVIAGVNVSRSYDFGGPTRQAPRDGDARCGVADGVVQAPREGEAKPSDDDDLPKDLLSAIDKRISWTIEATGFAKQQDGNLRFGSTCVPRLTTLINYDPMCNEPNRQPFVGSAL